MTAIDTARLVSDRPKTAVGPHDNNFRVIRHCAAAAVVFSHAFVLTGGQPQLVNEPLHRLTGKSCGEIAVDVFFVISGFLVSQSLFTRRSLLSFVVSRALRIYPALITVVALTAFVLGPAVSTKSPGEYFSFKHVYSYAVFDGTALTPFRFRSNLPGVFEANPYPEIVNGSLWTLPWEVWMYASLAAVFVLGLHRGPSLALIWVGAMLLHLLHAFEWVSLSTYSAIALRFIVYFYSGVAFYRYRNSIPLTFSGQAIFAAIFVVVSLASHNDVLLPAFMTYTIMFLAMDERLVMRRFCKGADISYGVYLYSYPLQQLLVFRSCGRIVSSKGQQRN
jgi:peptidoglycan/LPS O-acetylase OafA/YrhL